MRVTSAYGGMVPAMSIEFGVFDLLLALHDYYEQRLQVIEAFDRFGFLACRRAAFHIARHGALAECISVGEMYRWNSSPCRTPHPPPSCGRSPDRPERAARREPNIVTTDMPDEIRVIIG